MKHEKHIIITAESKVKAKIKKRLHTLDELAKKRKHEDELAKQEAKNQKKGRAKKSRSIWRRALSWLFAIIFIPTLLIFASLFFIASPMAEENLTSWVNSGINYLGKPADLKVQIGRVSGFWSGNLKIYDVRVQDKYGPWLYVEEGTLSLDWGSVFRAVIAVLQYQQSDSVSSFLHGDGVPLSKLRIKKDAYVRDKGSILEANTKGSDGKDLPSTLEKSSSNQLHGTEFGLETMQKNIVPIAVESYDADVIDNLLEPEEILKNKVVIGIELGTLLGVRMPRFPRYAEGVQEDDEPEISSELSFLPPWCAIDIGELELADFHLGPSGRDIFIGARFQGQIGAKQLRIRSVFLAEKSSSGQWVLPFTQDLPADITLSLRELSNRMAKPEDGNSNKVRDFFSENKFLGLSTFDYDAGNLDVRFSWLDSLISQNTLQGLKSVWARMRMLGHLPTWPPTDEKPMQAKIVSRFGATYGDNNERIKASLASAQFYTNGESFIVRDLNVLSPIQDPNITISGSAGMDPIKSFGTQFKVAIKDIALFADVLGLDATRNPITGKANLDVYITRGGKRLLWWTKPLPPVQEQRAFAGFIASPYDFSILAQDVGAAIRTIWSSIKKLDKYAANPPKIEETRLPSPSRFDDGLQLRIKFASPVLTLPSGPMQDVFLSINAKSVDAFSAPSGTAFVNKDTLAEYKELQANDPRYKQSSTLDFTADGVARGLVGNVFARIGDMHEHGTGGLALNWFLGGMHDESRVLQLEIEDFGLRLPGINSEADIGFAYALPMVSRNWPWIDGTFSFNVESWRWLGAIMQTNIRGSNVELSAKLKSFLDANGKPQQYMDVSLGAARMDSTQFLVRDVYGTAKSENLHALADILALSVGNLREALEKKLVYVASPNTVLMESQLNLGAGRSGGFSWDRGSFDLRVIDENATFKALMHGDISAILNGTYSFRKRVVGLKALEFIER